VVLSGWLAFLDTYRTMCVAPQPEFRHLLEGVRAMRLDETSHLGGTASVSG
jgi:hypothetical protein